MERFYSLVNQSTSVRAVQGSTVAGKRKDLKTLFVEDDPSAIAQLLGAVQVRPLGARFAFMTPGDPTLALSSSGAVVLTIQCLGDEAIRSDALSEDAILVQPGSLQSWIGRRASVYLRTDNPERHN